MVVDEPGGGKKEESRWRREQRMRFEILSMLYKSTGRRVDVPVELAGFVRRLGVWEDEFVRILNYLSRMEYIRYEGEGPYEGIAVTLKGADYLDRDAGRRRSIRD